MVFHILFRILVVLFTIATGGDIDLQHEQSYRFRKPERRVWTLPAFLYDEQKNIDVNARTTHGKLTKSHVTFTEGTDILSLPNQRLSFYLAEFLRFLLFCSVVSCRGFSRIRDVQKDFADGSSRC